MNRSGVLAWCAAMLIATSLANRGFSEDIDPKALAVLQRLIDARNAEPNVTVELVYEIVGEGKRAFRLHALDDNLRIDEFRSSDFNESEREATVLVLGGEAWGHRFGSHNDLIKTTPEEIRDRGFIAFTPLQIGISTFLTLDDDLEALLFANSKTISLLEEDAPANNEVRKVEVHREGVSSQYTVGVAAGRIMERINFVNGTKSSGAASEYEGNREPLWLPQAVRTERFSSGRVENLTEIRCVSTDPNPELFELKSLGIPPRTPVVDFDLQRRIGYWNGAEILPEGAVNASTDVHEPQSWTWVAFGTAALALGGVIVLVRQKNRKSR